MTPALVAFVGLLHAAAPPELDAYLARVAPPAAPPTTVAPAIDPTALEVRLSKLNADNDRAHSMWLVFKNHLEQRRREIQRLNVANPYDDVNWRSEVRENLLGLCCMINRHPELADAIRKRIGAGRAALPHGVKRNHQLRAAFGSPPAAVGAPAAAPTRPPDRRQPSSAPAKAPKY